MTIESKGRTALQPGAHAEKAPSIVPQKGAAPISCFIIDDEQEIQKLIAGALAPLGCQIRTFTNAKATFAALSQGHPDFVFLDVSLEKSDAVEVMRGLGRLKFAGKIQLISGRDPLTLQDLKLIGDRNGLSMLPPLQKPFRIAAIRQIMQDFDKHESDGHGQNAGAIDVSYQKFTLSEVMENNWLQIWYQPKIDIQRMKPVGAEALARCVHPVFGEVRPASFMPGASEEAHVKLGERVLVQSMYDWPLFNSLGIPFKLAINMPVAALLRIPVARVIRELRPKESEWPGLVIEVTEDQAVKDTNALHEIATQLKLYGVSIAIDDFGSGYSNLGRLRELPFAELKIDRSLIMKCDQDAQVAKLCRTAIDLAHEFGSVAVAEGVERTEEVRALQQMSCDVAQGFLFAHPTPRDKLIESMRKRIMAARTRA